MALRHNTKKIAASVLALGAASAAVVFGSMASWTANTSNPGNSVTAGELALSTDHPSGAIGFDTSSTKMAPGWSDTKTVTVTNDGNVPMDFKLSVTGSVKDKSNATSAISNAFGVRVMEGSNCIYPTTNCATTYGTFAGFTTLANAPAATAVAGGSSKTYTVKLNYDSATSDTTDQAKTVSFDLNWQGII